MEGVTEKELIKVENGLGNFWQRDLNAVFAMMAAALQCAAKNIDVAK